MLIAGWQEKRKVLLRLGDSSFVSFTSSMSIATELPVEKPGAKGRCGSKDLPSTSLTVLEWGMVRPRRGRRILEVLDEILLETTLSSAISSR